MLMRRAMLGVILGLMLLGLALKPVKGDDFGKIFEKAAKKAVKDTLKPSGGLTPGLPGSAAAGEARGEPVAFKTADGWTLVVHHYKPTGAPKPGAMPVILCHGLTYNASFWDLDPSVSFAEYLAAKGHDVWAVDLRGSGLSQKWVWKADEAPDMIVGGALRKISKGKLGSAGYATIDPKFANWTLDSHIAQDVPATVNFVRRKTGAAQVAWVGHSMGGIVAIAHLARHGNPGIGQLATIGSQVTMPNGQLPLQFIGEMLSTRQRQLTGEITGAQVLDATHTSVHNMFFNVENTNRKIYDALSGPATDVPGIGLMQQYSALGQKGELLDAGGRYSYARNLKNITVPMFISCGASDSFAPPVVQKYLYDNVGSQDKTIIIFGRRQGFTVDCGHDDTLVGKTSAREVYPVIEKWLH